MIISAMANHPNRRPKPGLAPSPKASEIRAAREAAGLTQTDAGALVYAPLRTWQDWEAEGPENRRMHPAIWELWLLKTKHLRTHEALRESLARLLGKLDAQGLELDGNNLARVPQEPGVFVLSVLQEGSDPPVWHVRTIAPADDLRDKVRQVVNAERKEEPTRPMRIEFVRLSDPDERRRTYERLRAAGMVAIQE